jgi:hypothetical protein
MAKLSANGYYKPTPAKLRKLGDALLSVSTAITGYAIYEEHKIFALAALAAGIIGKFLTNFYSEDE